MIHAKPDKEVRTQRIDAPIRHPNAEFVLSRDETAQLIATLINAPYASETLRKSGVHTCSLTAGPDTRLGTLGQRRSRFCRARSNAVARLLPPEKQLPTRPQTAVQLC